MEIINHIITTVNRCCSKSTLNKLFSNKVVDFPVNHDSHADKCKHCVKNELTNEYHPKTQKEYKRHSIEERFSESVKALKQSDVSDSVLKAFAKKLLSKIGIFRYRPGNENYRYFESNTKGSGRYNKKQEWFVRDMCAVLGCELWETYALTLTYDIKKFGENIFYAWKGYDKHIKHVLENLRKHHGAMYLRVLESTKKGYPHTHIVIAFPKGTTANYESLKDRQKIKSGWLYNYIKENAMSRIFDLEKISGKNCKNYLAKYISKNKTSDLEKVANKKGKLSDAERKYLLGLMCTICTETRIVANTRPKTILKRGEQMDAETKKMICAWIKESNTEVSTSGVGSYITQNDVDNFELDYYPKEPSERLKRLATIKRSDLIKRCTNSPLVCQCDMRLMNRKTYNEEFNIVLTDIDNKNHEFNNKFTQKSISLGCSGCFFSHFQNLILNGFDESFDFFYWNDEGIPVSLFDSDVQKDDYLFMKHLQMLTDWFLIEMYINKVPYRELLKRTFINERPIESVGTDSRGNCVRRLYNSNGDLLHEELLQKNRITNFEDLSIDEIHDLANLALMD